MDIYAPSREELYHALGGRPFSIDEFSCADIAKILKRRAAAAPFQAVSQTRPKRDELLYRLVTTAISHQINWDFLCSKIDIGLKAIGYDTEALARISPRMVESWLSGYSRPERIRSEERADLLRDVGQTLLEQYAGDCSQLFQTAGDSLYGNQGLVAQLDRFKAYSEDPMRKKTNVLIHDLVRDHIAHFNDEQLIEPAIDYHIMRLYLRSGRVVPVRSDTFEILKKSVSPPPHLIRFLREAVAEALSLTAFYAHLSIPEINGIEWHIGREICHRLHPLCDGDDKVQACPYKESCHAYVATDWRSLKEPNSSKPFY